MPTHDDILTMYHLHTNTLWDDSNRSEGSETHYLNPFGRVPIICRCFAMSGQGHGRANITSSNKGIALLGHKIVPRTFTTHKTCTLATYLFTAAHYHNVILFLRIFPLLNYFIWKRIISKLLIILKRNYVLWNSNKNPNYAFNFSIMYSIFYPK
jgi:hypothetical protein